MKTQHIQYLGDLRSEAKHLKSGTQLITDAPTDNHGKGESFSPTDLLVTSLGTCMLTIMGIAARTHGFSLEGVSMDLTKTMVNNPRKVQSIGVTFHFGEHHYSDKEQELIRKAALECPVALSLHPDVKMEMSFNFPD